MQKKFQKPYGSWRLYRRYKRSPPLPSVGQCVLLATLLCLYGIIFGFTYVQNQTTGMWSFIPAIFGGREIAVARDSKVLIYITTHFSSTHAQFLRHCWPTLLSRSRLYRTSELVMFVTLAEGAEFNTTFIKTVFGDVDITVHVRSNPGYSEGAILAMAEGFQHGWFEGFDWVIRVNPDVLIRNDSFLLENLDKHDIDGVFADCLDVPCSTGQGCKDRLIHTDFFAFRPDAIPHDAFVATRNANAEQMATKAFSPIIARGRDYWVPGAGPHHGICRIRGETSPVMHTNEIRAMYPACLSWYSKMG